MSVPDHELEDPAGDAVECPACFELPCRCDEEEWWQEYDERETNP